MALRRMGKEGMTQRMASRDELSTYHQLESNLNVGVGARCHNLCRTLQFFRLNFSMSLVDLGQNLPGCKWLLTDAAKVGDHNQNIRSPVMRCGFGSGAAQR